MGAVDSGTGCRDGQQLVPRFANERGETEEEAMDNMGTAEGEGDKGTD